VPEGEALAAGARSRRGQTNSGRQRLSPEAGAHRRAAHRLSAATCGCAASPGGGGSY